MLLKQLRYFVTAAKHGSFTEASLECGVSQSAVSQQIKALETELGVELVARRNRGFALTHAGKLVLSRGEMLLREADALYRDARAASDSRARIRAGYLRCFGGDELHLAVAEFSERRPEISIEIVRGCHEELYDLLRFGGADIAVSDQRRAFSDEYVNFVLADCGCWAEFSGRSELAALDGGVELEALAKIPCILAASPEQYENEIFFYKNTLGIQSTFSFAESVEEGRLLAAANAGYLLIEYGARIPRSAALLRLPVYSRGVPIRRSYCAFWKKSNDRPELLEFAETLRKIFNIA